MLSIGKSVTVVGHPRVSCLVGRERKFHVKLFRCRICMLIKYSLYSIVIVYQSYNFLRKKILVMVIDVVQVFVVVVLAEVFLGMNSLGYDGVVEDCNSDNGDDVSGSCSPSFPTCIDRFF